VGVRGHRAQAQAQGRCSATPVPIISLPYSNTTGTFSLDACSPLCSNAGNKITCRFDSFVVCVYYSLVCIISPYVIPHGVLSFPFRRVDNLARHRCARILYCSWHHATLTLCHGGTSIETDSIHLAISLDCKYTLIEVLHEVLYLETHIN
jgi:hypothetical protein